MQSPFLTPTKKRIRKTNPSYPPPDIIDDLNQQLSSLVTFYKLPCTHFSRSFDVRCTRDIIKFRAVLTPDKLNCIISGQNSNVTLIKISAIMVFNKIRS